MQAPAYGGSTYLGAGALDVNTDGLATVGDMGHLDEDGYLYLADRRVDLILSGGANVFPAEVEAALIDHPAVADVVVIGLRDPEWGQRVHAIIEPKEGAGAAVVRRRGGVRQVAPRRVQGARSRSRSSTSSPAAPPPRSTAAPSSPNANPDAQPGASSDRQASEAGQLVLARVGGQVAKAGSTSCSNSFRLCQASSGGMPPHIGWKIWNGERCSPHLDDELVRASRSGACPAAGARRCLRRRGTAHRHRIARAMRRRRSSRGGSTARARPSRARRRRAGRGCSSRRRSTRRDRRRRARCTSSR